MVAESHQTSESAARQYGLPGYLVTITGDQITATVRPWHPFGRRVIVARLSDYVAVGHRIVSRRPWLQRFPSHYRQAILIHRDNRFANLVLGETRISLGESHVASLELRAMLEKFGEELALPVIDADRPLRKERPLRNAAPDQVFETRFPDEFDWSIRELVTQGRLVVSRDIARPPRGLTMTRQDGALRLTFRYSALWEALKIVGFLLTLAIIGWASSRHSHHSGTWESHMLSLVLICGAVTAFVFLIVFPILHVFNGNELLLADDHWIYKAASGALLLPSVQALSQLRLSEIEEIYRDKRDVVITTDREIVRIRCRSRSMAEWMSKTLLAVAAYGLSVLDGIASPQAGGKDKEAGAGEAPASQKA